MKQTPKPEKKVLVKRCLGISRETGKMKIIYPDPIKPMPQPEDLDLVVGDFKVKNSWS